MMTWKISLSASLLLIATGCQDRGVSADQAVEVANGFMTETLPQVSLGGKKIETIEDGKRWRVSYSLPDGGTGGPILVFVDKKSGKVVDSRMDQ
jgi:hypothetical protein